MTGQKTGGRTKGTPNKVTTAIRQRIDEQNKKYFASPEYLQDSMHLEIMYAIRKAHDLDAPEYITKADSFLVQLEKVSPNTELYYKCRKMIKDAKESFKKQ